MTRLARPFRTALFLAAFGLASPAVRGQDVPPPPGGVQEEEGTFGGPVPGYLVTGLLACATIFVLCKSARR